MANKMNKLEQEKCKLSEKWIKLSAKNKNEDKVRNKLKELEDLNDKKEKELFNLLNKMNKNERENTLLRKANDSLQNTINQHMKKIKSLKSSNQENNDERAIADQVTNELLEKINQYEQIIEDMRVENENLVSQLNEKDEMAAKIQEYEENILKLQEINQNLEGMKNEELAKRIMEFKEEWLLKETENFRLKEKNENLQNQILNFKEELDSLQEFINIKEDQIRNRYKDEEVWICLQMLIKELISVNKKESFKIIGIDKKVDKADLDLLIKSNYLNDSYVRFAIVNSIAYLHEWKESLNYLKQKYAESELKYDNIIEKYQTCKNERNNLQNNSLILENNIKKLLEENQTLSEERFFIIKSWMQNQSQINANANLPSFIQSYDALNLQKILNGGNENYSTLMIDDDVVSNMNHSKIPVTSRVSQDHQINMSQLGVLRDRARMSQNYSNWKRNISALSNRVSWDAISNDQLKANSKQTGGKLWNKKKNYSSTTSISFYKPHNPIK